MPYPSESEPPAVLRGASDATAATLWKRRFRDMGPEYRPLVIAQLGELTQRLDALHIAAALVLQTPVLRRFELLDRATVPAWGTRLALESGPLLEFANGHLSESEYALLDAAIALVDCRPIEMTSALWSLDATHLKALEIAMWVAEYW